MNTPLDSSRSSRNGCPRAFNLMISGSLIHNSQKLAQIENPTPNIVNNISTLLVEITNVILTSEASGSPEVTKKGLPQRWH
jgi:hypothetical protein